MATFYELSPEQAAILMDGKHTLQAFFLLIEALLIGTFNNVDEPNHGLLYEEIERWDQSMDRIWSFYPDVLDPFWELMDAMGVK